MEFTETLARDLLVCAFFLSVHAWLAPDAEDELVGVVAFSAVPLLMLVSFLLDQYPRNGGFVLLYVSPIIWALAMLYGVLNPQLSAGLLWRFVLLAFLVFKTAFDMCVRALRLDFR